MMTYTLYILHKNNSHKYDFDPCHIQENTKNRFSALFNFYIDGYVAIFISNVYAIL